MYQQVIDYHPEQGWVVVGTVQVSDRFDKMARMARRTGQIDPCVQLFE